jgi:HAD superfamily hydrolase (TIGR01509 family)
MIKTIYFDLGNVLCFFDQAKMLQQIATCCGLSLSHVKTILLGDRLQESYELGKIDTLNVYRLFKSKSSKFFSLHEFTDAMSDIFTPNTELWPVVENLKQKGLRLILISNTCESHYNRIYSAYPILHLFDHKILSFEVGLLKPDPRIFKLALLQSQCSPSECFYIDDIPAFIRSAKKAGLQGAVFTDVPRLMQSIQYCA